MPAKQYQQLLQGLDVRPGVFLDDLRLCPSKDSNDLLHCIFSGFLRISEDFSGNSIAASEVTSPVSASVVRISSAAAASAAHQWHRMSPSAVIVATKWRQQTGAPLGPGTLCLEFGKWLEFHQDHWISRFLFHVNPCYTHEMWRRPDVSVEVTRCHPIDVVNDK